MLSAKEAFLLLGLINKAYNIEGLDPEAKAAVETLKFLSDTFVMGGDE